MVRCVLSQLKSSGSLLAVSRILGHRCAHIVQTGPGEPPEDGEMTLPSRHRIRNSSSGDRRPSTLPLGNGGFFTSELERNILFL